MLPPLETMGVMVTGSKTRNKGRRTYSWVKRVVVRKHPELIKIKYININNVGSIRIYIISLNWSSSSNPVQINHGVGYLLPQFVESFTIFISLLLCGFFLLHLFFVISEKFFDIVAWFVLSFFVDDLHFFRYFQKIKAAQMIHFVLEDVCFEIVYLFLFFFVFLVVILNFNFVGTFY